ncbi:MAG: extracellular solute-binding protein [Lachnospiraceae bacterium]
MKKRMKKLLALLLAMSMCVLSACGDKPASNPDSQGTTPTPETDGGPAPGGEDTEGNLGFLSDAEGLPETLSNPDITIVYWYNQDQYAYDTSKNENVYDPILEAIPYFEEKYGGKVNVIYAAWGDMLETVLALQKAGDAPDLFEVFDESMYSVILSGVVSPLDDLTTDADYSYYKVDKELFSWNGSVYAIPLKPYAFYIMFNRDLFDLEGMKAPDELFAEGNWNWSTFRDACKSLTKTVDGEPSQLGYGSYEDTILSFMYANGGSLLNVDTANGTVTSNLNSVESQNTLNYLVELKDSFVYGNDMWGWFDNGTMAMIRGKEYPVDTPFEVGMVPFPTGDDYSGKNLVVYPQGMAVPAGAKNPEGAVAFMRIVNELQKEVGDQKEANRIGQENYDMIYADDVELVYAYDKCLNDIGTTIATIVNYINDGVPAATINANMEPEINSKINLMLGN